MSETSGDGAGVALLFVAIAKSISYSVKLGAEIADSLINQEKIRKRLNILEYQEDAKNKKSFYTPNESEEDRLVEQIKINDPDFDKVLFEKFVQDIFTKFQTAYCNNNLDSMRKFVDVNIIEQFKVQAVQNKLLNETEKMDVVDFNFVDFFGYHIENGLEVISVAVSLVLYDYVKDKDANIIRGSDKIKRREVYILSFARKLGGKTINNIKDYKEEVSHCPNCGSTITNSYSECEHCGTILFNSTENWLLNHIEAY